MSRRSGRTKTGDLVLLGVVGTAVYLVYGDQVSRITLALLGVAAAMIWTCFLMPTYCDVQTLRRGPCRRRVDGKLRGCRTHAREKRDAMFAAFSLRNPGLLFRAMWTPPGPALSRKRPVTKTSEPAVSRQAAYDVFMLTFTMASAIAAVLALFK